MPTTTIESVHVDNMVCPECNSHVIREDYDEEHGMCRRCNRKWYRSCRECNTRFRVVDPDDRSGESSVTRAENRFCPECRAHPFDKIVSDTCEGDFNWNDYFVIVEEGSNVNFGCNFDCKGKCSGTRCRDKSKWEAKSEKGCCVGCAEDKGYLHNVPIEAVLILEALWNEVDGFWTSEGCTLPAKYRSWTCNAFVCNMAKKSRHFDLAGYQAWRDKQTELRASARLARLEKDLQSAETEKDVKSAKFFLSCYHDNRQSEKLNKARREEIKQRRKAAKAESAKRRT